MTSPVSGGPDETERAIYPQVLTADTPEPARPWRVVYVGNPLTTIGPPPSRDRGWTWKHAVRASAGRPVYVISGDPS